MLTEVANSVAPTSAASALGHMPMGAAAPAPGTPRFGDLLPSIADFATAPSPAATAEPVVTSPVLARHAPAPPPPGIGLSGDTPTTATVVTAASGAGDPIDMATTPDPVIPTGPPTGGSEAADPTSVAATEAVRVTDAPDDDEEIATDAVVADAAPPVPAPTPAQPVPVQRGIIAAAPATAPSDEATTAKAAIRPTGVSTAAAGDAGPRVANPAADRSRAPTEQTTAIAAPPGGEQAAAPIPVLADGGLTAARIDPAPAPADAANRATVRADRFVDEMRVAIGRQIAAGREEVTVRLDPPELGRIHVRIGFDTGGELRTVMATETAAALQLMRRNLDQLDLSLAQAGVRTDAQSFRFENPQPGGGNAGGGNAGGGDGRQPHGYRSERADDHAPTTDDAPLRRRRMLGRVDMIA